MTLDSVSLRTSCGAFENTTKVSPAKMSIEAFDQMCLFHPKCDVASKFYVVGANLQNVIIAFSLIAL